MDDNPCSVPMLSNYFGRCPDCADGCLFAVKTLVDRQLFVMCDMCETRWRSPQETITPGNPLLYEGHEAELAVDAEIKAAGWMPFALRIPDDE